MTTQPKPLRLADWLESSKLPYDPADVAEAATELRRQHELIMEMREALRKFVEATGPYAPCSRSMAMCSGMARAAIAKVEAQQCQS